MIIVAELKQPVRFRAQNQSVGCPESESFFNKPLFLFTAAFRCFICQRLIGSFARTLTDTKISDHKDLDLGLLTQKLNQFWHRKIFFQSLVQ